MKSLMASLRPGIAPAQHAHDKHFKLDKTVRTNWVILVPLALFVASTPQEGLNYGVHSRRAQLSEYEIYMSNSTKTVVEKNQRDISRKPTSAHPYLICPARLGQISHPFDTMVATLFEHLQKPHDQPRRGKHKDLEIDVYRWSSPDLTGRCAGKLCSPIK